MQTWSILWKLVKKDSHTLGKGKKGEPEGEISQCLLRASVSEQSPLVLLDIYVSYDKCNIFIWASLVGRCYSQPKMLTSTVKQWSNLSIMFICSFNKYLVDTTCQVLFEFKIHHETKQRFPACSISYYLSLYFAKEMGDVYQKDGIQVH